MKPYKSIIFDFDGTLADSLRVMLRAYASLSQKYQLGDVSEQDIQKMRAMTPFELLHFIHLPIYKLPFFLFQAKGKYKEFASEIRPFPSIAFVLMELQKKYSSHILTSNDQSVVLQFLQENDMNCFESITSEPNIFGKDHSLRKVLKEIHVSPESALYIGDEVRDIEACRKVGVPICSVTWGLNAKEFLLKHKPEHIIDQPEELLEILLGERITT